MGTSPKLAARWKVSLLSCCQIKRVNIKLPIISKNITYLYYKQIYITEMQQYLFYHPFHPGYCFSISVSFSLRFFLFHLSLLVFIEMLTTRWRRMSSCSTTKIFQSSESFKKSVLRQILFKSFSDKNFAWTQKERKDGWSFKLLMKHGWIIWKCNRSTSSW